MILSKDNVVPHSQWPLLIIVNDYLAECPPTNDPWQSTNDLRSQLRRASGSLRGRYQSTHRVQVFCNLEEHVFVNDHISWPNISWPNIFPLPNISGPNISPHQIFFLIPPFPVPLAPLQSALQHLGMQDAARQVTQTRLHQPSFLLLKTKPCILNGPINDEIINPPINLL